MNSEFIQKLYEGHRECPGCPTSENLSTWFDDLLGGLFPDYSRYPFESPGEVEEYLLELRDKLVSYIGNVPLKQDIEAQIIGEAFYNELPRIHASLLDAVDAIYKGDPAAKSKKEVIRTYPGFFAIAAHRVAHALHTFGTQLIPRIISEYAHSKTGIDIHPAAKIGDSFCIDHGTGIVIGETTEIGNKVKIYQGVTLGALSVNKQDATAKRHPTIGDNVIIYSGATILGGETFVGDHSVIGGNVWLTESVPEHSKIYYTAQMSTSQGVTDTIVFKEYKG